MNYYEAREIKGTDGNGTGKFHYTCMNDRRVWPVGYCSPYEECPECKGRVGFGVAECKRCDNKGLLRKDNPCPGHESKEEANEHYKQFMLDHEAKYDRKMAGQMLKCRVCGEYTEYFATVGGYTQYVLCDAHRNREELEKLYKVGISMES